MLATFCLRLACGLVASVTVLAPSQVPPRFFRVQYLAALGLLAVAGFFLLRAPALRLTAALGLGVLATFAGSVIWHVEGHPGHRIVLVIANVCLFAALIFGGQA